MIPNDFRRGQRRVKPGEVLAWRPATDASNAAQTPQKHRKNAATLARIRAEQAAAAAELARGAADVRGLRQAVTDWVMEEVLCVETNGTITARRQTPVMPS
jgi:hypothetical protein